MHWLRVAYEAGNYPDIPDSSVPAPGKGDGSLLVCAMEGEYRIKRYRKYPRQHLEDLSTGKKEALPVDDDGCTGSNAVFGVITHVINDARSGEFDDCPVI
ncbi:TPA: DNA repair protein [Escherichia coli]|nr:DNA repair protein [Escherichia coli]HDO7554098.1 DNA repair protein [Escherichia coli]